MKNANHKHVDFEGAHSYVENFKNTDKKQVFWNGYDIVIWDQKPGAYMTKNALYRNGAWGVVRKIAVTERGTWRVPVVP